MSTSSIIIIVPLVLTFIVVIWNMYLPVSSAKNAEFLDYTKHILVDNYKNNNYISDYIDRPVVGPIQKYFHTAMADDFHDTGPRSLHEFIYKDRHVTLTFYIQYGNQKNLMTLLDLLDHYDIRKAVFFFENRYINEHEFVIKRIQESGYVVKEWNNLNSYNESPYEPSIYKGIPLIQGKILKNVHTDRVAANFLDAALHNQKGSIIAFTPDIISHEIILEKILKQNGHGLVFTDSDTVNVAYDTIKNVSSEQDNSLKVIGKDDKSSSSSTTSPVRINSGKWTMDTLQMQYPSIVKYVNDAFFIVDPIIIHNRAELDITDSKVFLSTSSYSNGSAPVYIRILGKGSIVNSTVTSSDPTSSDVGSPSFDPYHPRPYLIVTDGGKLNIINSTISHLGYSMGGLTDTRYARAALGYYDASDFIIANSTIAFNYYGFYSENSDKFKIMSNKIYGQTGYGLDPHTASGDFIIDSNYVHDNGNQGIICSMDCYNVTITNNVVEYNVEGIGLHWLTNTSTIKDNIVRYNDKYGIFIQKSSYDNTVENNTVLGNDKGIGLLEGSNNNRVVYNTVADNSGESIYISSDSKQNKINGNSLLMDGKS